VGIRALAVIAGQVFQAIQALGRLAGQAIQGRKGRQVLAGLRVGLAK